MNRLTKDEERSMIPGMLAVNAVLLLALIGACAVIWAIYSLFT